MKIQRSTAHIIKENNLPARTVVIELLDKNNDHLAFIARRHNCVFSLYDLEDDRETSSFLEEISNFEAELLADYFRIAPEMEEKFGGWTGEMIITDEDRAVVHHEYPAQ